MGYCDYLKAMLAPMRVYDLDTGYGADELEVIGAELDNIAAQLAETEREMLVPTATDSGLVSYESIMPYVPSYVALSGRRAAIEAMISIDGSSFTVSAMQRTLSACGICATVEETGNISAVKVTFPGIRGVPENIEALKKRIEQILPCHLTIQYGYLFCTWNEMEEAGLTWAAAEAQALKWSEFEAYGG